MYTVRTRCHLVYERLYNAVVRYCDNIPSGEAVMVLIQEATELLRQSEGDGLFKTSRFKQSLQLQANEEGHAVLFQGISSRFY